MKWISIATVLVLMLSVECTAQITIKTEYFGTSAYRDEHNQKVGNSKGSAMVYHGSANLPLSMKKNESNQPTIWGIGLSGDYASLNNKNIAEPLVLSEILNLQMSLFHVRPLSEKWSMMVSVSVGVYTDDTRFSHLRFRNVLGSAGLVFVRRILPNLELGVGLALNNAFGYPMAFPALYVNWNYGHKLTCSFSALDGANLAVGYNVNKTFSINFITEMGGQMALTELNGDDKIFTHQYIVVGFRPEFKVSKHISLPVTVGINAVRNTYYDGRSLSAFFKVMGREYDPCFQIAPYFSVSIVLQ